MLKNDSAVEGFVGKEDELENESATAQDKDQDKIISYEYLIEVKIKRILAVMKV